jgi:hypothetical protein
LKLNCGEPLSNFAFNFNLRRYTAANEYTTPHLVQHDVRLTHLFDYASEDLRVMNLMDIVFRGIGGFVWCAEPMASVLVLCGMYVASPLLAVFSIWGGVVGLCTRIFCGLDDYQTFTTDIVFGDAQTMMVIGGMFNVPSVSSALLATMATVTTTLAVNAFNVFFSPQGMSSIAVTMGFTLTCFCFLLLRHSKSNIVAVKLAEMSTPEDHLFQFLRMRRIKATLATLATLSECTHWKRNYETDPAAAPPSPPSPPSPVTNADTGINADDDDQSSATAQNKKWGVQIVENAANLFFLIISFGNLDWHDLSSGKLLLRNVAPRRHVRDLLLLAHSLDVGDKADGWIEYEEMLSAMLRIMPYSVLSKGSMTVMRAQAKKWASMEGDTPGAVPGVRAERRVGAMRKYEKMSFAEFVVGMIQILIHAEEETRMRPLFAFLDGDGSGEISRSELSMAYSVVLPGISESKRHLVVERVFRNVLKDKDEQTPSRTNSPNKQPVVIETENTLVRSRWKKSAKKVVSNVKTGSMREAVFDGLRLIRGSADMSRTITMRELVKLNLEKELAGFQGPLIAHVLRIQNEPKIDHMLSSQKKKRDDRENPERQVYTDLNVTDT